MRSLQSDLHRSLLEATVQPGVVFVCGPRGVGKSHAVEQLVARHPERALRVIDGCGDPNAVLDAALLAQARSERIVITGRGRPRSSRARVIPVGPLAVPAVGASREELRAHPTVVLFQEWLGHAASATDPRAIAAIIQKVDGVAELCLRAAERTSRLGAAAVLALLDEALDVEAWYAERPVDAGGYRAFVASQLAALPPATRQATRAAALFPGGFDYRALVRVAGGDKRAAIYTIEALLERGLLVSREDQGFVMLRAERELVRAELGADPSHAAAFVAALVAATQAGPTVDASPRALAMRPNVEAALELAAAARDAEATVTLTRWLGRLVLAAGPVGAFVELGERLVQRFERGELRGPSRHAEARWLRGMAKIASGAHAEAEADFAAASESAEADPGVRAIAYSKRALLRGLAGDFDAAAALARQAHERAAAAPAWVRGELVKDEANLHAERGSEHVYESLLRARAIFRQAGYAREEAFMVMMLAGRACDHGEIGRARQLCKQTLELLERVGDRRSQAWALCVLGLVEQEACKVHRAANRFRRARRVARGFGDELTAALATGFSAGLALERGLLEDAQGAYATALEALQRAGQHGWVVYFEAGLAAVQAELGRLGVAAETSARALSGQGRPGRRVASEILAAALDVSRAQRVEQLEAIREGARRRAEALSTEETRFAWRVIERQVNGKRAALAPVQRWVGPHASWYEIAGRRVDLSRRHVLHRLFARLVLAPPHTRVSTADLVRHVWSGEHVSAEAAANRLYVAVARLRTEGLANVLLQDGAGYFLACELVHAA